MWAEDAVTMHHVTVWLSADGNIIPVPRAELARSPVDPQHELEAVRDVFEQLIRRIQSEYAESPGLQLTGKQAERLWSLDNATCAKVLDALVERGALVVGSDKRYRRRSS